MCADALSEKLQEQKQHLLPKLLFQFISRSALRDVENISIVKEYGFKIIEDASHAMGASYNDIKVGSCIHSDITVFSLHPVKIITTAEGGIALTNDQNIADKIHRLRTHGITSDKSKMVQRSKNEIWNYQQIDLGFNYRMNDIQAVLGLSQLKRLDEYVRRRHEIAKYYDTELKDLPITTPWQAPNTYSAMFVPNTNQIRVV